MPTEDSYAVVDATTWKEQDGKFFYNSGTEGEIPAETIDLFEELYL